MQIESDIERKQDAEYARADRNQVIVSQADDDGDEGADHDRRVGEWMFEPEARCDCRAYNQGDSGEGVDEYGGQRDQGAGALEKNQDVVEQSGSRWQCESVYSGDSLSGPDLSWLRGMGSCCCRSG